MKRALFVSCIGFVVSGCAALIGASFDDAGLAVDASFDAPTFPDVSSNDGEAAPPFDPLALPNLGIWLDATYQVDVADAGSGVVTRWHDRSAFARDAVPAGGGSNAPMLVPNALNGHPVVHFTAAQLDVLVTSWVGPGSGELTMFVVSRGYPNSALRFQNTSGSYPFVLFPVDKNQVEAKPSFVFNVGAVSPNYVSLSVPLDGGATIATASFSANGTADTYTNGVLDEQQLTGLALPNAVLWIGGVLPLLQAPYTTVPFADGDIAEAIVYTNALGDSDRVKVEAYLRAKWGLGP